MKILSESIISRLFYEKLLKALKDPLFGEAAHRRMWAPNRELMKDFTRDDNPVKCAVAVLFFPGIKNEISLLLIKRTPDKSHHSGQISFPGGKAESCDTDLKQTALRELNEETGTDISGLMYAGALTPLYIPVSNFIVHPLVFFSDKMPELTPCPEEVEYILTVPFNVFTGDEHLSSFIMNWKGKDYVIPCYKYNDQIIWGATAMMISEMAEVMSRS